MVKVYCLGNQYVTKDSVALRFVDRIINDMQFKLYNSEVSGDIWILDVCRGIEEMRVENLDKFMERHPVSMHDFDAGNELKLLQAMGQVGKVNVIAIPMGWSYDRVLSNLKSKKWVEQEIQGS